MIYERKLGPTHANVAISLNNLALLYWSMGKYTLAEPLYQRSWKINEKNLGPDHPEVATNLFNLGMLYWKTKQYAKAEPFLQRSLRIQEAKLGPDHLYVAKNLNQLALLYRDMGQYAKAEPLFQRSLKIYEVKVGPDHLYVATSLFNLAYLYWLQGQYARAEPFYQRQLTILEKKLGPDHAEVAQSLTNLALLYRELGQYAQAEPLFQRSLQIREDKLGWSGPRVANSLNNLAGLYRDMGQYAKAEPLFQRSLQIREDKLGPDHLDVAQSLNNLALLYQTMGQYTKAEPLYQRSFKIREDKLGPDHLDVAQSLNNLAWFNQALGEYTRAESFYQRSLKIYEAKQGPNHLDVALSLTNLASLYQAMGQYARAESLHQRSLKIREAKLGSDHPKVAASLNYLGLLYWSLGQYDKAEPFYQRSLKIREEKLGPDHPAVAASLNNLAMLYWSKEQYAKAEPLYQRSLKILEEKLGPDHPEVAQCLNNLAKLYWSMEKYDKAERLFQHSLNIGEERLPDHPIVAQSLNNLALLYQAMGQYAKAEPLLQRSLDINRARLGRGHPRTFATQANLAELRLVTGHTSEALRLMHQTVQLDRAHQVQVLPILSEKEQLQFLASSRILRRALSMALAVPLDSENVVRTASWVLNSKAVAQQALAERSLLARDAQTPEAEKLLQKLTTLRQELSQLSTEIPAAGQEEIWKKRREEVTEEERLLSTQLSKLDQRSVRDDPWIDLDEVTRRLPERTALVDIARFPVIDFKAPAKKDKEKPAHYVAWVTRKDGAASLVDLGEAGPIDERITRVRRELAGAPDRLRKEGEVEAEKAALQALQALADKVLQPLRKHLDDCTQWVISPDGNLWLVPWAALPLDEKTYAIEKHTIQYVISGRDLVLDPLKLDRKPHPPLVVADPDFDLGVDEVNRLARENTERASLGLRNLSEELKLGRVPRLPFTALEGRAVIQRLKKQWPEALLLTDQNALAEKVRTTASPRVLVLSTHGFFLPEQETKAGKPGPEEDDSGRRSGVRFENPLLRCGLLLAGCNHFGEAGEGSPTGVLTGLDVVSMDLRGTELVVLSACETGLGDTHNGEGVAGLRQAFQLAGAEAVLASLWSVADRESARLMVDFWDNLAQKPGKAEALRQAQLKMIQARREANAAAHPFYWAAFTLTGLSEGRKKGR